MSLKHKSSEMDQLFEEWIQTGDYPINDPFYDFEGAFDAGPHEPILAPHPSDVTQTTVVCQTPATTEALEPVPFSNSDGASALDGDQIWNAINGICARLDERDAQCAKERVLQERILTELEDRSKNESNVEQRMIGQWDRFKAEVVVEVIRQQSCIDILLKWWEDAAHEIRQLSCRELISFEPKSPLEVIKAHGLEADLENWEHASSSPH